jgi:hypothetical protein
MLNDFADEQLTKDLARGSFAPLCLQATKEALQDEPNGATGQVPFQNLAARIKVK